MAGIEWTGKKSYWRRRERRGEMAGQKGIGNRRGRAGWDGHSRLVLTERKFTTLKVCNLKVCMEGTFYKHNIILWIQRISLPILPQPLKSEHTRRHTHPSWCSVSVHLGMGTEPQGLGCTCSSQTRRLASHSPAPERLLPPLTAPLLQAGSPPCFNNVGILTLPCESLYVTPLSHMAFPNQPNSPPNLTVSFEGL